VVPLAIGVILVAWLAELAGLSWHRLALIVAITAPSALLAYVQHADFFPLFLLTLVGWVSYTGSRSESYMAVAFSMAAVAVAVIADATDGQIELTPWISWPLGIIVIWVLARTLAFQRDLVQQLRAAQEQIAVSAVSEERRRIARELHDLIAHSLTVTLLQLTGARRVLRSDPDRAAEALAEAERIGRESLLDIRRTVGLLKDSTESEPYEGSPLPRAEDISTLIEEYRKAGLDIELVHDGAPEGLSTAASLGLYRIAQEAIANTVKHAAGGRVRVSLKTSEDGQTFLVVHNSDGLGMHPLHSREGGAGLGLIGMRERATLLGASLEAGPVENGWQVTCILPKARPGE
jgi:signal transduction histidine kinase